jgi:cytochrome c-type biogenesis protein CcmH/NrfG
MNYGASFTQALAPRSRRRRGARRNPISKRTKEIAAGAVAVAAISALGWYLFSKPAAAATNPAPRPVGTPGSAGGAGQTACDAYHNALKISGFPAAALAVLKQQCIASGGTP